MPSLRSISSALLAGTLLTCSAATAQSDENCDLKILDPFNPKWVEQYGVACNNARRVSTTPPIGLDLENGIPFERLKTMPVAGQGPITFTAKTYDANGNLIPKTVTLPDPVIIDDGDSGFIQSSFDYFATPGLAGYQTDWHRKKANEGAAEASWTFSSLDSGT